MITEGLSTKERFSFSFPSGFTSLPAPVVPHSRVTSPTPSHIHWGVHAVKPDEASHSSKLWRLVPALEHPEMLESQDTSVSLNNEHKLYFKAVVSPLALCMWATGWGIEEVKDFLTVFTIANKIY